MESIGTFTSFSTVSVCRTILHSSSNFMKGVKTGGVTQPVLRSEWLHWHEGPYFTYRKFHGPSCTTDSVPSGGSGTLQLLNGESLGFPPPHLSQRSKATTFCWGFWALSFHFHPTRAAIKMFCVMVAYRENKCRNVHHVLAAVSCHNFGWGSKSTMLSILTLDCSFNSGHVYACVNQPHSHLETDCSYCLEKLFSLNYTSLIGSGRPPTVLSAYIIHVYENIPF